MCSPVILVVDDEILVRMLMADSLRDEGYQVIEAASGDEGMAILRTCQQVDRVITDVRMPGQIDGVELAVQAKRLEPGRPVLIVSGHLPPDAAQIADEFLPKPYVPSQVVKVIHKLIGPACQRAEQNRHAS